MSFGISAATAAVVGGGLAAAGAVGGALISAKGAKSAAAQQAAAANDANALQQYMYDQTREDQAPWRTAGNNALNELTMRLGLGNPNSLGGSASFVDTSSGIPQANATLYANNPAYRAAWDQAVSNNKRDFNGQDFNQYSDSKWIDDWLHEHLAPEIAQAQQSDANNPLSGSLLKNFSVADFQADPGYDFRLAEGMRGIENSAAARGGLLSGAALKAAGQYNQNFASNEYQNAYNRFNTNQSNQFNRLASLAGVGQTATNATQQAGQNYANQAGSNLITAGNAAANGAQRASGYLGQGIGFATNQLANVWGNYGGANNPYGSYSAQSSPVNDYYAGTQPYATLS